MVAILAASFARSLEAAPSVAGVLLQQSTITGIVINDQGPVTGATVRIQLTEHVTTTAKDGSFSLTFSTASTSRSSTKTIAPLQPITVTAWAAGHYIGWTTTLVDGKPVTITLNQHYTTDNVEYEWFSHEGVAGSAACGTCHIANSEWKEDAHSQSATNIRFLTLYAGTDIHGNKSPLPTMGKDGKSLPPDLSKPYFRLRFQTR